MRGTKIVCTIGPASESKEMLTRLIEEGMNVARLNFSHGTHEEQGEKIRKIKELREEMGVPIAIALDTRGPEIRLGTFACGPVHLVQGDKFTLTSRDVEGTDEIVSVSYKNLPKDLKPGMRVLIDDGLVELKVESIENGTDIHCVTQNNGTISDHKGVNIPEGKISLPALTDQDEKDIKFGIKAGIDFIFVSFVRSDADVNSVRKLCRENGGKDIQIYSKIEAWGGVENITEIINASDGLMVARGDLGVEIEGERVPLVQKQIIRRANLAAKPVITATQMLDSMQYNPRPTRAEINDVANAILDGSDAIMLSGETAAGAYPAEAVRQMSNIAEVIESSSEFKSSIKNRHDWSSGDPSQAMAKSCVELASELEVKAIVTSTSTGFTSRMISKYRPKVPIIAVTPYETTANRLAMVWGVHSVVSQISTETDALIDRSILAALNTGIVEEGDTIILTAGIPVGRGSATNMMKVHTVGNIAVRGQGLDNGSVVGPVAIGSTEDELKDKFKEGDIIVAKHSGPDLIPFIEKCGGVVVEEEGRTNPAAIVGPLYNKPTVIGGINASQAVQDGEIVTVDSSTGLVYRGENRAL